MPDQPKFCVVPVEPRREMWAASANALIKDRSWLNIAPDFVTEASWNAMLAARGPEAEAMCAVPKSEVLRIAWLLDEVHSHAEAERVRALLNPAKE